MLLFVLLILHFVCTCAKEISYSRAYLKSLGGLEKERIVRESILTAYRYIESGVISAAKEGLVEYISEPYFGCDDLPNTLGIDRPMCEQILKDLLKLVSERFADSDIIFDSVSKRYTLMWD
jgi:hypothetical protein